VEKLAEREEPEVDLSVIITCYFEEQSIDVFYERLSNTLKSLDRSYEIIFINDGSTDRTFEKLRRIFDSDKRVTAVIDLFKNTGQANAKTPGIMIAKGKAMVAIDSDLQLDPEELPRLVSEYDKGYDMVTGYRKKRNDTLFRKLPSKLANVVMRKASGTKLRDFGCTFKIYDMRLVHGFEFGPFKPWKSVPVIAQAGRIAEVPVSHHPRPFRKSGWTFRKLFAYNMENLVNLSERPFQILGVLCLGIALAGILRLAAEMIFPISILPIVTPGLLLNVIVIGFLAILAELAAIGEFVIRNFVKLQNSPAFIIREIYERRLEE
jgi:undecaprenyl-phosphate 4-deoxy-4-formamido-L-arabinose transferase